MIYADNVVVKKITFPSRVRVKFSFRCKMAKLLLKKSTLHEFTIDRFLIFIINKFSRISSDRPEALEVDLLAKLFGRDKHGLYRPK